MEHPPHQQPEQIPPVMPDSGKGKRKRLRDWTEEETSVLLKCVNLPQFRHQKRKQSYMKWDAIADEIQKRQVEPDSAITGKRCQERMKTLRGYYHQVRTKKKKASVTEKEWRKSNGLSVDWWYKAIGDFQGPRDRKATKSTKKKIARRFNSLKDSQRSTLLDLIFHADYFKQRGKTFDRWEDNLLARVCEWLSIVQKRRDLAIYEDVIALEKMGLVSWEYDDEMGEESDHDGADISGLRVDFESLRAYKKFFKKVMERNSAYDTRRRIQDEAMVKFDARRAPSGVMMLRLCKCKELEVVDLSGFRKLRWLSIWDCGKVREMIGWECLEELGWLEIWGCPSYDGYPPLQKIPSLQKVSLWLDGSCRDFSFSSPVHRGGELDVSGCVQLRRLNIFADEALPSIRGLEGLRSLTVLDLRWCTALRNLPDIGHMKDLTHLTIYGLAVEEIKGIEKLLSLEELDCSCSELKTLSDLTHLPHLRRVLLDMCPVVNNPSSPYYKRDDVQYKRGDKDVDVSDTSDSEWDVSGEEI